MLEEIKYMTNKMMIGPARVPENWEIVSEHPMRDTKTGNSGVLLKNKQTGKYGLWSYGTALKGCDPKEAKKIESKGEKNNGTK